MVHISLQEQLEYQISGEPKTSTSQKLQELLRLKHSISIGVTNLEQLLQVPLKHLIWHFIPHWHAISNIWSQVALVGSLHQSKHSWHKLIVLDHTILVHISSL